MFGKQQPEVVSDKDVGDYIDDLKRQGEVEVNNFILEEDDEVVRDSTTTSCKRDSDN